MKQRRRKGQIWKHVLRTGVGSVINTSQAYIYYETKCPTAKPRPSDCFLLYH